MYHKENDHLKDQDYAWNIEHWESETRDGFEKISIGYGYLEANLLNNMVMKEKEDLRNYFAFEYGWMLYYLCVWSSIHRFMGHGWLIRLDRCFDFFVEVNEDMASSNWKF